MSVRIRQVSAVVGVSLLVLLSGCGGNVTWLSPESLSDDGYWTAKAHTNEYSGFGTGAAETTVEIVRTKRDWRESPQEVLQFGDRDDVLGLKMRWDGRDTS